MPHRTRVIASVLAVSVGGSAFAYLADAASEGDGVTRADPHVSAAVVDERSGALTVLAHVLTTLGSEPVVSALALVTIMVLLGRDRLTRAVAVGIAMAGSAAMTVGLKLVVGRARPGSAIRLGPPDATYSFPSGHTLSSAVLIGMVALLVVPLVTERWTGTIIQVGLGLIAVGIGLSRVYLGYHWATDVVGSWLLAIAWVTVVVLAHGLVTGATESGGSQATGQMIAT